MATNAENVRVGITGELFFAPLGTALPTDASTALAVDFTGLGFVDENGLGENWEDSVDDIIAWQNSVNVRSARTESKLSLSFTLIETTGHVLELFHPGSTMTDVAVDNFQMDVVAPVADPRVFVANVIDGSRLIRLSFPNAELVERGEVPYRNGDSIMYPITLRAYPDANNLWVRKNSNDTAWSAA